MSLPMWVTYLNLNATSRDIPWDLGTDLPAGEAAWTIPSLREFQRGENSDGAHLRRIAAAWARRHHHDPGSLLGALDLFVAEEQRHAAELARFLALNGHAPLPRCASDTVFRLLRQVTGSFMVAVSVLMTAEIVGYSYDTALRAATGSPLLRRLCDTFLRDAAGTPCGASARFASRAWHLPRLRPEAAVPPRRCRKQEDPPGQPTDPAG